MIPPGIIRLASLCLLGLVCAVTLFFAVRAGNGNAQSKTIAKNAEALSRAIKFFHQDNNRYPSEPEFASGAVMGSYISPFPPEEFATGPCTESFTYKAVSQQRFELRYCLPRAVGDLAAGWHTVTE